MGQLALEDSGTLIYEDTGSGPALLCVHGWAMHSGLFAPQRALSARLRIIAPDLRGHGRSSPLPAGDGLETLAADLSALLAHLDLERVVLYGWSMGALLAWRLLAGNGAARIAGLIVEDMAPRILNDGEWSLGLAGGHDAATTARVIHEMRADWPAFTELFVPRIFAGHRRDDAAVPEAAARDAALAADPASMAQLWASMARADFRAGVRRIDVPALIVFGGASRLYPAATSEWLAAEMPHAHCICFETSGHAPHLEESARFNHLIVEFVDRVRRGGARDRSAESPPDEASATAITGDRS